jgi:hypothetical protein
MVQRSHLGLDTAVSSRYQYISLFSFGPLAGLLLVQHKKAVQVAVLVVWMLVLAYPWKRHAPRWAAWRGVEIRTRVDTYPADARIDPSPVTAGQARELTRRYRLH